jgi:methionyl aminopeptidase
MLDPHKIETMKTGGKILGEVIEELVKFTKPGVKEIEIDRLAEDLIVKKGGKPGFKRVPGYKHTICISTNDVVVHGVPTDRVLEKGDLVGIDCGVFYNGFHTDMAESIIVGGDSIPELKRFLTTGRKALFNAIRQAKPGNRVGHVSREIQDLVEGAGYSIVRSLVGHGVGKELHEKPEVPGYLTTAVDKTPALVAGQTLAIEVIYNMGKSEVVYGRDDN